MKNRIFTLVSLLFCGYFLSSCGPVPNAGTISPSTISVCKGDSFSLVTNGANIGASNVNSTVTGQWQVSTLSTSGPWSDIAGATQESYTVLNGITAITYYRFEAISPSGFWIFPTQYDYSNPLTVNVNPVLSVNLGNNTILCNGDSLTLDAGNPGNTYLWGTNETTQTITVNTPAIYTVGVTNSYGCTTYDTIYVNPGLQPQVSPLDSMYICGGSNITLTAPPGASYLWNTSATSQNITVNSVGLYYVTVTSYSGCKGIDSTQVLTAPLPIDNLQDQTICQGTTANLNAGNPGSAYLWNTNATSQILNPANAGSYSVMVTNSFGCIDTFDANVTLKPSPVVDLGADTILCMGNGTNVTLDAGVVNASNAILWNTNANTQTITVSDTGQYIVTVTGSNNCSRSDSIHINEAINSQTLPSIVTICDGDSIILNAGNPSCQILWDSGETTYTIKVGATGNYGVTITDTAINCVRKLNSQVNLQALPTITLGADTGLCLTASTILDAGNQPPGSQFIWNTGDTTQTINVSDTGIYSVIVMGSIGCTNTDSIHVMRTDLPFVFGITATVNSNGIYSYSAQGIHDVQTYFWNFGDGNTSTEVNPQHLYASSGNYDVTLIVNNPCGSDTVASTIHYYVAGINKVNIDWSQLKLFPNPARNQISIKNQSQFKMQFIQVYNILGQEIFRGKAHNANSYQLNTGSFASGMYQIRINFDNDTWISRKFEIKK